MAKVHPFNQMGRHRVEIKLAKPGPGAGHLALQALLWSEGQLQGDALLALAEIVPHRFRRGFAGDMRDMVAKHFTTVEGVDIPAATDAIIDAIRESCKELCPAT